MQNSKTEDYQLNLEVLVKNSNLCKSKKDLFYGESGRIFSLLQNNIWSLIAQLGHSENLKSALQELCLEMCQNQVLIRSLLNFFSLFLPFIYRDEIHVLSYLC